MKLINVEKAPQWLKRDADSGVFYVVKSRVGKRRLFDSTGERVSKQRAIAIGERMIAKWLGHEADGSRLRVPFAVVLAEKLARMESQFAAKKIRAGTLRNARDYMGPDKILDREFGHLFVDQITVTGPWDGFVAKYRQANPEKKLFSIWKHMRMAMRHALKAKYIADDFDAPNPDPETYDERVPTKEEVWNVYNKGVPNLRDQMLLGATMGMRKMEQFRQSFRIEDCCHVDMTAKTITVCEAHSKTHRKRVMAMSPQVYEMLARRQSGLFIAADGYAKRRKTVSSRWVFPTRGNPNQYVKSNKTAWNKAKERAGITDVLKYHWLRRYFLTEAAKLVREGAVSVVLVCNYAGLSIKTFEKKYLKLNHNDTAPVASLVVVKPLE